MQAAARVKNDANWDGLVVAFSWPSFGFVANYNADEVIQARSVEPFIQFLKAIKAAAAIHILAHSMGNRIALEALSILNKEAPDVTPRLGQLIFAAADEDSEVFKGKFKTFSSAGLGRTLYLSSQDPALAASAILHYDNRAGQAWPPQQLVPYRLRRPFVLAAGLDCIDCSGAGLFENGLAYDAHGYFAQPPAIHDIAAVLQGQTVLQRTAQNETADGLTRVQHETDERLNHILTLTDNSPPPVSPSDIWWKLNTRLPVPAPPEVPSA
ncbi:hypothetical protein COCOBI_01-1850 [Coccomyxa sp. Obi]|nr:hypothetical protein COCOBI_01-1850 [Coccomyxa sp. Obi]